MVKYFHFHNLEKNRYFDKELASEICSHQNEQGVQCRKRCQIGLSKCWIHLLKDHHLRIKPSRLVDRYGVSFGNGLFVESENGIVFRRHDIICQYNGEVLTNAKLDERYAENDTAPYTANINKNLSEDASIRRGIGSLINHNSRHSNCKLVIDNERVYVQAKRNIVSGEELYVNYGKEYDLHQPGIITCTNGRKYSC